MRISEEDQKRVAIENLNSIPQKRFASIEEGPYLALYVNDTNYKLDLRKLGISKSPGLGVSGYDIIRNQQNDTDQIIVFGEESLKKLRSAGVNFPGADLFGPGPDKDKEWTKSV